MGNRARALHHGAWTARDLLKWDIRGVCRKRRLSEAQWPLPASVGGLGSVCQACGAELQTHHRAHTCLWCPTNSRFFFFFFIFLPMQWKLQVQTLDCLPYLCENTEGKLLFLALLFVWESLLLCTRQISVKDTLGSAGWRRVGRLPAVCLLSV